MLLCAHPDHPLPVGRKLYVFAIFFRAAHIADQARFSRLHIRRPDLLFGLLEPAGGIGHMALAAYLRSARIEHRLTVGRELDGKDVMAVIALILRHLAAGKVGRIRNPYIAFTFAVEDPGNATGLRGGGQRRGKRRTHYLFKGKRGFLSERRAGKNESEKTDCEPFHKPDMIAGTALPIVPGLSEAVPDSCPPVRRKLPQIPGLHG